MDPHLTLSTIVVLGVVLLAEAANGWTDAPAGTSAAVASGALKSMQALIITAAFNFVGLVVALIIGAAVAKTIGTGIVQAEVITVPSIGFAMLTTVLWAAIAAWLGLPVSKTHSLLAALAGIGYAQGGFEALLPATGNFYDSGWIAVGKGVFFSILVGSAAAYVLTRVVIRTGLAAQSQEKDGVSQPSLVSERGWRNFQRLTVCAVASGHGLNDGLKYVGIFSLVLYKSGVTPEFQVLPSVIILCAFVMAGGTLLGGWRIHRRLDGMVNGDPPPTDDRKRPFRPHLGVCSELVSGFSIWQSGWLGIPMSTTHAVTSAMAGARSATGRAHISSVVKIVWGWIMTYVFCFLVAEVLAT